jgi:hypothetical protein
MKTVELLTMRLPNTKDFPEMFRLVAAAANDNNHEDDHHF